ncbi:MAG: hypothetical protein H7328_05170 [Bdellovibrio sp.]|nr:hypothetical protein [Bdellovibrio sp.]
MSVFFLSITVFAFGFSAVAAEDSAHAEKARTRQYTGGADEGDLKVQPLQTKDQKNKTDQEANEGF